jgi:hypothetical protein
MMTVRKLRKKPRHFQSFTGLKPAEFDLVLAKFEAWEAERVRRKGELPGRRRAVGGGRRLRLEAAERLLMGLMYLRLYVSQGLLSDLFDLDASNVNRELNERLFPALLEILPVPLRDAPLRVFERVQERPFEASGTPQDASKQTPDERNAPSKGSPRRQIRTVEELFAAYPELKEVLADATEQPVPKPKDKAVRKLRFSGKKGAHTVKTQVLTTKKQILHVFGGLPGRVADLQLLRASGVLRPLPEGVTVRVDRGYDGLSTERLKAKIVQPVKARRNHPIDLIQRLSNRILNRWRIPVEHVLSRLKKFGCLADVWRGRFEAHEDVFCLVSGLVNFKATGQFQLTAD